MKKVIIYTTPWCSFCQMAKEFFTEHDIEYQEKNVAEDEIAREEMIQNSGQLGVPVIETGEDIVIGFNRPVLAQLLNIKE